MGRENSPADARIAALASRQHGVVARRQLRALGLSDQAIDHRLAVGRLHRLRQGVYAVGHPGVTLKGKWMGAALACGDEAVVSHWDAAALWNLGPVRGTLFHVTTAGRSGTPQPGIHLHRVRSLAPELRAAVDRIPVTSVPRTLLDLAGARDTRPLKRAWEAAQRLRLLDVRAVAQLCDDSPGRRVRPLRALIEAAEDAPDTREELEHRFADLLARHPDLPAPAYNALVEGYLVDAVWFEQRLIVELDSRAFHGSDEAFERDRVRDADLMLAGYRVYRVTWRQVTREPDAVVARLRRLLA